MGQLIIGSQSRALRDTMWQMIREAKTGDTLAPVTVIGPTRYSNLSLRHELGLSGFINVRFNVLPVLMEQLGAAAMARAGRKPLTSTLMSVALRAVLSEADGHLAPVRNHPSTLASLRASFRELRRTEAGVLEGLESQEGVPGDVARLYLRFRENIADQWYEVEDLAEVAAEAVRKHEAPGLDDLGHLVFYLLPKASPAETALILELARQGRCSVLLGTSGEENADTTVLELASVLGPAFAGNAQQPDDAGNQPFALGETTLHIAPNAHEELRWVIRQIVQEAAERNIPFHRMAILYRLDNPYATLIPDELDLADIRMAGPGRKTVAESGVGRTLLGILRLAGSNYRRSEVMSWLTGCPVRPPYGRTSGFNPSHWDLLTRRAGVVSSVDQWSLRLDRYADGLEEDADERERMGEIDDVRAAAMKNEASSARNASSFIVQLSKDLGPPEPGSTWKVFCKWAKDLLEIYLSHELPKDEGAAKHEVEARREVDRLLDQLPSADTVGGPPNLESFRQTTEEAMMTTGGTLGPTGGGVFVSTLAAAAGMSFDILWLVGMIEGGVPPSVRPDPLLPESAWLASGGRSRTSERVAAERYDYLSAVDSAPRRTLSYPVADGGSRRQAYPSRWFLEQASRLEGRRIYAGDLPALQNRPWLSVDGSGAQSLSSASDAGLADLHDYNLHRLLLWRQGGQRVRQHPLAHNGPLAKAVQLGRSRFLRRWTEFDGNLTEIAAASRFGTNLQETPVSATRLESWATCPFRYFLGQVLRLTALETPEETVSIKASDRGRLVHDILERFVIDAVQSGTLPSAGGQWEASSRKRLWEISEDAFRDAEKKGLTGKPLLWQLTRQGIREDLESFLEEDANLRAAHGTGHIMAETRFGFEHDGLDVRDDGTQIRFRGYIDRLDVSADGRSVAVIDYKTGSATPYEGLNNDPIDQGKRLQLGVYSMAARHLVPAATSVRAAYWFTTNSGGFGLAPPGYVDIGDSEVLERFRQGVSTIVSGIRQGVFPANPGPRRSFGNGVSDFQNCHYCDFNTLCPARRADIWERKKSDERLAGYISLAEGGDEE